MCLTKYCSRARAPLCAAGVELCRFIFATPSACSREYIRRWACENTKTLAAQSLNAHCLVISNLAASVTAVHTAQTVSGRFEIRGVELFEDSRVTSSAPRRNQRPDVDARTGRRDMGEFSRWQLTSRHLLMSIYARANIHLCLCSVSRCLLDRNK